jgi:hypothetical protein
MAPAISLSCLIILEDRPSPKQHEGSVMKAILFAVASIFVVTASATPSLARPLYKGSAESSSASGHQSRASRSAHRTVRYRHHYASRGHRTARDGHKYASRGHSARSSRHHYASRGHSTRSSRHQYASRGSSTRSHHATGAKPARWCGWWMRAQKGGGPELNLARNWRSWGRPSGPRVGAVVVWSHHVGMITGRTASGQWIVKSGNDGGRVRERPRSVAGAVFRV